MRLSQLFTKTVKDAPAEETARSAQLLIRAGYIHKEMAGAYDYLPLGLLVLENIKAIVRTEMNKLGANEILMTSLQSEELWRQTDRWDDQKVDVWFKSALKNGTPVGFGWSHEEPIAVMMKNYISSYRDLPMALYQFQTKLRNELRAKSGIMRGREFLMKDLYAFSSTPEELQTFYDKVSDAYLRVFTKVGLGDDTYLTYASGGAFTQFSHEFQTVTAVGEDTIYVNRARKLGVNREVYTDEALTQLGLKREELEEVRAAEVGNIFNFGTTKSEQLGVYYTDQSGQQKPVYLSSYGIGISRLMGVIAEHYADAKGLVWPEAVAPAQVYLVRLGTQSEVINQADSLYHDLTQLGVPVLYDDRDARPGEKFADADLLGIPHRVVVSDKTAAAGTYEWKQRTAEKSELIHKNKLLKILAGSD